MKRPCNNGNTIVTPSTAENNVWPTSQPAIRLLYKNIMNFI